MNLRDTLDIHLESERGRFGMNEPVDFTLVVENLTDTEIVLRFFFRSIEGRPLDRMYWFEVYRDGRSKPIHVQPHSSPGVLSEAFSQKSEELRLSPREAYRENFNWDPEDNQLWWFGRLWWMRAGAYRIELDLHLDPEYAEITPNLVEWSRLRLTFERGN